MKRYFVNGNPNKLGGTDTVEHEDGEWVKWEDAKWLTPQYQLIDYPEITQAEHEALHQESLSEGN